MQAFNTAGSLSFVHTTSRGAASWTSPLIVMAMGLSPEIFAAWDGGQCPK
jgi:hypothetical protein